MTTVQRSRVNVKLENASPSDAATIQRFHENRTFYNSHAERLWQEHSGPFLLVHGGGSVQTFETEAELIKRLVQLPEELMDAAIVRCRSEDRPRVRAWFP